jgi:tetratricopeptide (TPR) repeat protein
MTCRFLFRLTIVAGIGLSFAATEAGAWGPRAQKSIVATAFQVLSQLYNNPFKSVDISYEAEVLKGAVNHQRELAGIPLGTRAEAINAIGTELQILREVRQYGVGSYFSYRMGVLAGLVSDVMLPFTFEYDAQSQRLLEQINEDVDSHLKNYQMSSRPRHLEYVRNPATYFRERQQFFNDAKTLILADYQLGRGYEGYMTKGGQVFFENAVVSVADCWYTVLRTEGDSSDMNPSAKSVIAYFVSEVEFLLDERKNMLEAGKAYRRLSALNPNDQHVFERVGDAYYGFGTEEARERAVQEWDAALAMNGPYRKRILGKLSQHYLEKGRALFDEMGTNPDAPSETLQLALNAFTRALEYNRSDDEAANLINETQVAIAERNERQQMAIETVAAGEAVLREAESSFLADQNEDALANYEKAVLVFQQVTPEFKEQAQAAKDGIDTANRNISRIIRRVLDQAQDMIDEGDRLVEDKNFDEAMSRYTGVETVLKVVPDQEGPDAEQKQKLIDEALGKVDDAQRAKVQYEELQKTQTPAAGAPGARP